MRLILLIISYERLFPIIRDLSYFRWSKPIKTDPTKRDRDRRCFYHKDHGHTTEQCKSLHYLVEKLIKVGYLKQYVHTIGRPKEAAQEATIQTPTSLTTPKVVINYIHRGPVDDRHSSKRQRWWLLYSASIKERVNSVQHNVSKGSVCLIDDIVTFPPVDANWVLQPHEDTLVLKLGVGRFDMRRIMVYDYYSKSAIW